MAASSSAPKKYSPNDFDFGGILGQGAYAKVMLSRLKSNNREFAIKMVDKDHVRRYNKVDEMLNEKKVLSMLDHPGIIKLHYTFQDEWSLYYVLELAPRGEMFSCIQRLKTLPVPVAQHYAAQLVSALEYLHLKGIIHRDLKPENILLAQNGCMKLTDFATSKVITAASSSAAADAAAGTGKPSRKDSFVGTAEYVSPELLNNQSISTSSDVWALGCIIFQMLVGRPPFRGESEYLTFQKVVGRELEIPADLDKNAADLIDKLIQLEPSKRLGSTPETMKDIRAHPFFTGIDWEKISTQPPPEFDMPEAVSMDKETQINNPHLVDSSDDEDWKSPSTMNISIAAQPEAKDNDKAEESAEDSADDKWKVFLLESEKIVMRGLVQKRRGIFAKKRQLVLTDAPRFIYIREDDMEKRGVIEWSADLWAEPKDSRVFWIHTPKRDYYMEALSCSSNEWVQTIKSLQDKEKAKASAAS